MQQIKGRKGADFIYLKEVTFELMVYLGIYFLKHLYVQMLKELKTFSDSFKDWNLENGLRRAISLKFVSLFICLTLEGRINTRSERSEVSTVTVSAI